MQSRVVSGIAVVAALAAGGVGGALIGVPGLSGAQPFPNGATKVAAGATKPGRALRGPAFLDTAAKALHLTTQQLRDKLSDGKTTIADVAQQQHVDVNTVIDAIATADKARIGAIVNQPWPKFGPGSGPGKGPFGGAAIGGLGRGGLGRGGFHKFGAVTLDPVAKALGITPEQLKTDLGNGQTIAQIAKSKKIDLNAVIDTLVGDASKLIDRAVANKHLTQAQADKLKAGLRTEITGAVNNGMPKFGRPPKPQGGAAGAPTA
ncbi:MAG TPA: hypothetical protein VGP92_02170 [Acidimicrobiia bacterium]|jgi:hypothetical protein|nr:hypothetical protein [Acidimicrobiia bacterium]